jgi:hypothetical protein
MLHAQTERRVMSEFKTCPSTSQRSLALETEATEGGVRAKESGWAHGLKERVPALPAVLDSRPGRGPIYRRGVRGQRVA